jgi:hypothetical protein
MKGWAEFVGDSLEVWVGAQPPYIMPSVTVANLFRNLRNLYLCECSAWPDLESCVDIGVKSPDKEEQEELGDEDEKIPKGTDMMTLGMKMKGYRIGKMLRIMR